MSGGTLWRQTLAPLIPDSLLQRLPTDRNLWWNQQLLSIPDPSKLTHFVYGFDTLLKQIHPSPQNRPRFAIRTSRVTPMIVRLK